MAKKLADKLSKLYLDSQFLVSVKNSEDPDGRSSSPLPPMCSTEEKKKTESGIQFGKTMVFLRRETFDFLEREKMRAMTCCAVYIQRCFRRWYLQKLYTSMKISAIKVQSRWRIWMAQAELLRLIELKAICLLLRVARGMKARVLVRRARYGLLRLQSNIRRRLMISLVCKLRRNVRATTIAKFYRR